MVQTLREASRLRSWDSWERLTCPVLVVRASNGNMTPDSAREMAERNRAVRPVEVVGAEHDVHLDRPADWRAAVTEFIDSLDGPQR